MLPSVAEGRRQNPHVPSGRGVTSDEGSGVSGLVCYDNVAATALPAVGGSPGRCPSRRRVQTSGPRLSQYASRPQQPAAASNETSGRFSQISAAVGSPITPVFALEGQALSHEMPPGADAAGAIGPPGPRLSAEGSGAEMQHQHAVGSSSSNSSPTRPLCSFPNMTNSPRPMSRPGGVRHSLSPSSTSPPPPASVLKQEVDGQRSPNLMNSRGAKSAHASCGTALSPYLPHRQAECPPSPGGSMQPRPPAQVAAQAQEETPAAAPATEAPLLSVMSAHVGSHQSPRIARTQLVQSISFSASLSAQPQPQAQQPPSPLPQEQQQQPQGVQMAQQQPPLQASRPPSAHQQMTRTPSARLTVEVENSSDLLSAIHSSTGVGAMPLPEPHLPALSPPVHPHLTFGTHVPPFPGMPGASTAGTGADGRFLAELAAVVSDLQRRMVDMCSRQGLIVTPEGSLLRMSDTGSGSNWGNSSCRTSVPGTLPGTLTCDPSNLSSIFSVSATAAGMGPCQPAAAAGAGVSLPSASLDHRATEDRLAAVEEFKLQQLAATTASGAGGIPGKNPPSPLWSESGEAIDPSRFTAAESAAAAAAATAGTPFAAVSSAAGPTGKSVPMEVAIGMAACFAMQGAQQAAGRPKRASLPASKPGVLGSELAADPAASVTATATAAAAAPLAGVSADSGGSTQPRDEQRLESLEQQVEMVLRCLTLTERTVAEQAAAAAAQRRRVEKIEQLVTNVALEVRRNTEGRHRLEAQLIPLSEQVQRRHRHHHRRRSDQQGAGANGGPQDDAGNDGLQTRVSVGESELSEAGGGGRDREWERAGRGPAPPTDAPATRGPSTPAGSSLSQTPVPPPSAESSQLASSVSSSSAVAAATATASTARAVAEMQRSMKKLMEQVQDMVLQVASARAQSESCTSEIQVVLEQLRATTVTATSAAAGAKQAAATAAAAERTAAEAIEAVVAGGMPMGATAMVAYRADAGVLEGELPACSASAAATLARRGSMVVRAEDGTTAKRLEVWLAPTGRPEPPAAQGAARPDDAAAPPALGTEDTAARVGRQRRISAGRDVGFRIQPDGADVGIGGSVALYGISSNRTNMLEIMLGRLTEAEALLEELRAKVNKGMALRVTRDELRESMVQLALQVRATGAEGPADPWAPSRTVQELSANLRRRGSSSTGDTLAGAAVPHGAVGAGTGTAHPREAGDGVLGVPVTTPPLRRSSASGLGGKAAPAAAEAGASGTGGSATVWRTEVESAVASLQRAVVILEQRLHCAEAALVQTSELEARVSSMKRLQDQHQQQLAAAATAASGQASGIGTSPSIKQRDNPVLRGLDEQLTLLTHRVDSNDEVQTGLVREVQQLVTRVQTLAAV